MIQPEDREYAGIVAAIILAALVVKDGPDAALAPEAVTRSAGAAAALVAAVDRHKPPVTRKRT